MKRNRPKIYINARYLAQDITGVQRYSHELVKALDALIDRGALEDLSFELLAPQSAHDSGQSLKHIPIRRVGRTSGYAWEQFELPTFCRNGLLFCPGNIAPLISLYSSQKTVVTVHSLAYRYFPDAYSIAFKLVYGSLIPIVLRRANAIITVSESEKVLISSIYPFVNQKIHAVQNGAVVNDENEYAAPPGGHSSKPFVLYIGSHSKSKNLQGVLRAAAIVNREQQVKFIIVGAKGKTFQQMQFDVPSDAEQHIEFRGQINDPAEIMRLYRSAACLVFPSFYESSPLPPTEAMASGCPVIASSIPSLKERCADAAYYVDPGDPGDIARGIISLLNNKSLRQMLIAKGVSRAADFTWERAAREHVTVFRKVLAA